VLLIGAGPRADSFIRVMRRNREAPYRVEGLLSQEPELRARRIQGISVLGTPTDLQSVVERLKSRGRQVQKLIFTDDEPCGGIAASVLEDCGRLGISIARLPHLAELHDGLSSEAEVQPVAIEDLLGRPQVRIGQTDLSDLIRGRRVLITGAGGSIGSELSRQVAAHGPASIVLLDHSEFNLYSIDRALADQAAEVPRRAGLCDVRDRRRVASWFDDQRPEVVFHAAALKHVPLMEEHASDGVLTNVIGTCHVAEAARRAGCAVMVLISSDKAVNPVNVMGATKRVAEAYCQALDIEARTTVGATRFVTVRFGNVLGSAGSVVPLFQQQLARGGPLTVTHPDITRYFMTIPEAVQLVLQASASAVSGNSGIGQIFVLDMGEPIRDRRSRAANDPTERQAPRHRCKDRICGPEARREAFRGARVRP
jgi:FlaA1/EpsC-like NDP-sugar epimerase